MKKFLMATAGFLAAIVVMGIMQEFIWSQFSPPKIVGERIKSKEHEIEKACESWFRTYTEQLKGFQVPFDYRIRKARLDKIEVLEDGYVQLDYSIYPTSVNDSIIGNLELIHSGKPRTYQGQMVLHLRRTTEGFQIVEKMRPVQYQIQTPETQEEIRRPQTEHYKMQSGRQRAYYIADGILYVTYNGGKDIKEVPGGYEKVCKAPNGTYDEWLMGNSYIVTPEFTAFVGFTGSGTVLIYSLDQGETWMESLISKRGYKANTFLSKTKERYYATFAVDRALGSAYYGTFASDDLLTWDGVHIPMESENDLSCVFWSEEGVGYYEGGEGRFYLTKDGGGTYEEYSYPPAEQIQQELGFNPYDTMEQIYEEDGVTYMIIGQGDDGDYAKNGKQMKALYQSEDGESFSFVKEIEDETELAG